MKSVEIFRARGNPERGFLIRSYSWKDLIEVKSGSLRLLVLSSGLLSLRTIAQLLLSILPALALIFPLRAFYLVGVSSLPSWAIFPWYSLLIVSFFGSWVPLMFATFYVIDFVTIPLQARRAKPVAILTLMDIQMGTFRHILKASVNPLVPVKSPEREVVLTVLSTRKRLSSVLKPLIEIRT